MSKTQIGQEPFSTFYNTNYTIFRWAMSS